jgi:thiamine-phosphate pyrophosphorylase
MPRPHHRPASIVTERHVAAALPACARRSIAGLYALTPDRSDTDAIVECVGAAIDGGAAAVQYRNKSAHPRLRLQQAQALAALCAARGATFIVNDDIDLACAVDADGVHLGREDEAIATARSRLKPSALVGVSCYDSLARADAAVDAGADYIAFGSFFTSNSKPDAVRAEISLLSSAKARWRIAVVAIGGITPDNARVVIDAGADAVAVIGALFGSGNAATVMAVARSFVALFDEREAHAKGFDARR